MGLLDMLFREKGDSLSLSGYSLTGNARGGEKYGFVHHDARAIEIATKRTVKSIGAAYTPAINESGTFFIATAALTFTLPAPSATYKGHWYEIMNGADTDLVIASGTADTIVAFNDLAADSIAFSTSSEKIGSGVKAICDGTKWYVMPILGAETATPTIAT